MASFFVMKTKEIEIIQDKTLSVETSSKDEIPSIYNRIIIPVIFITCHSDPPTCRGKESPYF